MKETRAGKYGRNLAVWIHYTINSLPKYKRADYTKRFVEELTNYCFDPRKKGEIRNQGCVLELSDIVDCDIKNPGDLAKLVKEGVHLMYQKQTAAKVIKALLENITKI